MPDIQAFRAFRYDLGRVGTLSDVVAPPYDVIDAELQQKLYDRSPYNVIRLILNKELPTDTERDNRYIRAAGHLRDWQNERILVQDSARSLYVCHQEFEVEGNRYTRKGFMARVRLEPFGEGSIYAHEETMPGPKADRLKLFHATNMNLSQVFSFFPDKDGAVQQALDAAVGRAPPLEAVDHLGVVSRLWPITDQQVVSKVTGLMASKPIFIADGHHRYETALRYLQDKHQAGEAADRDSAPNYVLMMLVGMSDPGLIILPTHRLISGLPPLNSEQLRTVLAAHFEITTLGHGDSAAKETWESIEMDGGQNLLGFCSVSDGAWHLARFRSSALMSELAQNHSEAWRGLGVSILHVAVLGKLLPTAYPTAMPTIRYVHLLNEVTAAVAAQECQLAVLVPPASMQDVEHIAGSLEKMPAKSTYFYPKLLSGLVFNSLKGQ